MLVVEIRAMESIAQNELTLFSSPTQAMVPQALLISHRRCKMHNFGQHFRGPSRERISTLFGRVLSPKQCVKTYARDSCVVRGDILQAILKGKG